MKIKLLAILGLLFVGNYCLGSEESIPEKFPMEVVLLVVDSQRSSILLAQLQETIKSSSGQEKNLYTIPSTCLKATDCHLRRCAQRCANEIGISAYNLELAFDSTAQYRGSEDITWLNFGFATNQFTGTPIVPTNKLEVVKSYEWVAQSELGEKHFASNLACSSSDLYNQINDFKG